MSFDNTYNANRFKLPLFQVTGQTCLRSVYNAAFGLIDNERREGFQLQFLTEAVRELTERHGVPLPDVVITDYDQAMKEALDNQFPDRQQQLCIHHVNADVLLNAKRKWKNAKESEESDGGGSSCGEQAHVALTPRDVEALLAVERQDNPPTQHNLSAPVPHNHRGVIELWRFVVFAETKEEHEKAWAKLCDEFNDQQAILMYPYRTYLPIRAQWAQCFIKKHRNFGFRVTSGTEASYNNVKSYLLNGMSNLYSLFEAIEAMLTDQERDFIDACAQDEVLTSGIYSGPSSEYLGELLTVIETLQALLALSELPGIDGPGSHGAAEQRKVIQHVPGDYNIWNKIGFYTGDNHGSNDKLGRVLSEHLRRKGMNWEAKKQRIRCHGHVINLAVRAFLFMDSEEAAQAALEQIESDDEVAFGSDFANRVQA
ncbi:mutator-like element [Purpureocillium lilacinum]|uniref:Mutator-like element n=1 Tax=Purpureocillium lilacinum TaxID=33203 RepID=A0A179F3T0_PURLI|nr:mutator-like element [Purpureocillium lilacinum]